MKITVPPSLTGTRYFASRAAVTLAVFILWAIFPPVSQAESGGVWHPAGAMEDGRYNHTATLLPDGSVLVAGGQQDSEDFPACLSRCELYEPASESWRRAADLASVRSSHTATLLEDGRVLVAGGQDRRRELATVEIYDPGSGCWGPAESMTQRRMGHTATRLEDGRVLVAGGVDAQWDTLMVSEIYDPASGTWTSAGAMTHSRGWHRATRLPDGRVFVFGGWAGRGPQETAEIFDPVTSTWHETASLEGSPLYFSSQTLLPGDGGLILVAGGYGSGKTWKALHLFDPDTNTWFPRIAEMFEERNSHTATLLSDGRVLLAGGWCRDGFRHGEVFDPARAACTRTGPMAFPSAHHTATLLRDGAVLVAGGRTADGALNRAEIYQPPLRPVPVLMKIHPPSAPAGTPGLTLSVFGTGFTADSHVRWAGEIRDTAFVNSERLKAFLPAADFVESGAYEVTVWTPPPGGGMSGGVLFTVEKTTGTAPEIMALLPSSVTAGGVGFVLRVLGGHFTKTSGILWNGRKIRTRVHSSRSLAAFISSRETAVPGTATVQVFDERFPQTRSDVFPFSIVRPKREPAPLEMAP